MGKNIKAIKRISVLIVTSVIILLQVVTTFAAADDSGNFSDVQSTAWYYKDVTKTREAGYVVGVGGGKYSPDGIISYAQYLTIIARICDSNINNIPKGENWYDQYITSAINTGTLDKNEAIDVLAGIPREMMIKYTCKSLGIEPYTGNEVVFADVKAEDAAYINAAYNEYLTEGAGRVSSGQKKFGIGELSNRAQLATMALRIQSYRADPVAFKAEKAAARAEADAKYQAEQDKYTIWNGYKIYNAHGQNDDLYVDTEPGIDFGGHYWVGNTNGSKQMQIAIASKHGEEIAAQAIKYGNTKTDRWTDLITKSFKTSKGYIIEIYSSEGDPGIAVRVYTQAQYDGN